MNSRFSKISKNLLKAFLSVFVIASVLSIQLHEISHIAPTSHLETSFELLSHSPKTKCEICEVRAHTPLLKVEVETPSLLKAANHLDLPAYEGMAFTTNSVRLPFSRGPPIS